MLIDKYLNQTIYLKTTTGHDVYGKEISGAKKGVACRFHPKQVRKLDKDGNEYLTDAVVWIKHDVAVSIDDVITYGTGSYKVNNIDTKIGFNGAPELTKLFVKKT